MCNVVAFLQLDFSDDIVKIIQAAINSDGGQPEVKKANSMVKSFFIRVSWTIVILESAQYHSTVAAGIQRVCCAYHSLGISRNKTIHCQRC